MHESEKMHKTSINTTTDGAQKKQKKKNFSKDNKKWLHIMHDRCIIMQSIPLLEFGSRISYAIKDVRRMQFAQRGQDI